MESLRWFSIMPTSWDLETPKCKRKLPEAEAEEAIHGKPETRKEVKTGLQNRNSVLREGTPLSPPPPPPPAQSFPLSQVYLSPLLCHSQNQRGVNMTGEENPPGPSLLCVTEEMRPVFTLLLILKKLHIWRVFGEGTVCSKGLKSPGTVKSSNKHGHPVTATSPHTSKTITHQEIKERKKMDSNMTRENTGDQQMGPKLKTGVQDL